MLPFFRRRWLKLCALSLSRVRSRSTREHRCTKQVLLVESLETRDTPAAISWTGTAGTYNWGDAGNWSTNTVPTAADDVTINILVSETITISGTQSAHSLSDSTAALDLTSGSLTLAANSTVNENFEISGGTLTIDSGLSISTGALTNDAGGTIEAGTSASNLTGNVTNAGTVTVGAGDALQVNFEATTPVFTNQGTVTVNAAGLATFEATYNADGGTISGPGYVSDGILEESATTAAPTTILVSGITTLTSDNLAGYTLWAQGTTALGSAVLDMANGTTNHGTILLESASGNYNETLNADTSGSFTNAADGTIQALQGTGGGQYLNGNVTNLGTISIGVGAGLTLNTAFTNSGSVSIGTGGALIASAGYTQQIGTTTLTGATLASSSTVALDGGTLTGTGTVSGNLLNASGIVAPGSPVGALHVTGTYTQDAGGALDIDITGSAPGTLYDQLDVTGVAALAGALNVSLSGGYTPSSGTQFDVISFASSTGDFTTHTGFGTGAGVVLVERFTATSLGLLTIANLLFESQLPTVTAGQTFAPVQVAVLNGSGQVMTSDNSDQITLTINQGTLFGTLTEPVVDGIATYSDLSITRAGAGYKLTAAVSGQAAGTSNSFTVTPAAPTHLVYQQQPGNVLFGEDLPSVQLALEDQYDNVETGDNSTQVTLSLVGNAVGASLTGASSVTDVAGVATFTGLTVSEAGTGFTLQAQATGAPASVSQPFNVSARATTTSASSASAAVGARTVNLSATVADTAGVVVNEGTITFTLYNGASVLGTPVTVPVAAGSATASYTLPAGTPVGTYAIRAVYNGATNFTTSTDASQTLVIAPYSSTTDATSASTTYDSSAQSVHLSAVFTSTGGTVNSGTATFTALQGSTVIGTAVTVNVTNGAAGATYTLPAGTAAGTYTIQVVYNGTTNFATSTDNSQTLFVSAASTTATLTVPSSVRATSGQAISLNVTITSPGGTVNSGTETFMVLRGGIVIGSPITVAVSNGAASVSYVLPGGAPVGTYTVRAVYSGTADYASVTASTTFRVTPGVPLYAAGSGSGGPGVVAAFSPATGAPLLQFAPFGAYAGGVQVAVGDVNGDGYDDLIVMAGPGALNGLVQIYSGQNFSLISEYFAFPGYQGAFNLAVGDLTGNGIADVIFSTATAADFVFAYAGASNTFLVSPFSAFGGFTGGVTVAAGDVLGNGVDQIIVGTASQVGAAGVFNQYGQLAQPYYFAPIPMNGVNVAAGDLNDSGHDDIIFGARTDSTLVLEFDGASQNLMGFFFAFPGQSFGVTVATEDPTGDGYANIVTGFTGNVPAITVYTGLSFQLAVVKGQPSGAGGVNVAGSA